MSLANWNVLVVEDEADSMELVQDVLSYSGIHSVGATSGEEALRVLKEMPAPPTIIILDLALPGLNGWQLMNVLKANKSMAHIPCIAITAFHTPELAEQAIEAGFNAYFAKPIDSMSFVRELQTIVGH